MSQSNVKVAWVTGASSGIGEALARALVADGWSVILSGRREDALRSVAAAVGGDTLVLPFEATDYAALTAVTTKAVPWRGRIDLLVNNAGISQRSLAVDTEFDVYRRLMEVDFFAPLRLTQLVLPGMVERGSGAIVAISSLAGRIGSPLRTGYCAAKHALLGYFEALRAEVETAYGVKVLSVMPGSVRTAVAANALLGDGDTRGVSDDNIDNGMDPADVARLILEALADGRRELIVAEGAELNAATLRVTDPERLWDGMAREGARLAVARDAGGAGFRPDPARVERQ
jgi:dehydrogenase/reductase SDR family protein 7B